MLYCIFQLIWYYVLAYISGLCFLLLQIIHKRKRNKDFPLQTGKVAIVTGGAMGIGFQVSKELVAKNVHVIIGGRCEEDSKNAIEDIRKDFPNAKVDYIHLDLASLKSVREFAETFLSRNLPLHILINNAGIMFVPYRCTEDGYESQLQVNYLSHFYLTQLLLDKLSQTGTPDSWSRVVNVSSCMHLIGKPDLDSMANRIEHWYEYSCHKAYADCKLLSVAASNMLARRLREEEKPVSVCSLHPGVVRTNLFKHVSAIHRVTLKLALERWAYLDIEQGAATTLYAALSPDLEGQSGCYYDNLTKSKAAALTYDENFQNKLWSQSISMIENTRSD